MKLCLISSSGGHYEELSCLAPIARVHDAFVVTEDVGAAAPPPWARRLYTVRQINRREPLFLFRFLALFFTSFGILKKEQPDCVISTGALATYPLCLLAKLQRRKIVYIESFARVDAPSLTGRLMVPLSDLFIVQWEEMLRFYPNALYAGGIF